MPDRPTEPRTKAPARRPVRQQAAFVRASKANRSLERGLGILRAFRLGSSTLKNGEIAERTGLSKSTVSRLTATLVASGFLQYDAHASTYRLGSPLLSLGHSVKEGSWVLREALPIMREMAEGQLINVGLAVPDGLEMVYLESVRRERSTFTRHIVSGFRLPIELTALGRAYLASLDAAALQALLRQLAARNEARWPDILAEVERSLLTIGRQGYCRAIWQPGMVSIAAPLRAQSPHAVNVSYSTVKPVPPEKEAHYARLLISLVERIDRRLAEVGDMDMDETAIPAAAPVSRPPQDARSRGPRR